MKRKLSNDEEKVEITVYDKDSKSEVLVWFQLVDSVTGEAYKRVTADYVCLAPSAFIAQFRKAVKTEYSNKLSSVDAGELIVYKNKQAFDKRNAQEGKVLYFNNLKTGRATGRRFIC